MTSLVSLQAHAEIRKTGIMVIRGNLVVSASVPSRLHPGACLERSGYENT